MSSKSSKRQTRCMAIEKSLLSGTEICLIMEAGSKAGVAELKFRDLHVTFGRPAEQVVGMSVPYPFVQRPSVQPEVADLTSEQHAKQTKDAIEMDEITLREERLAKLLIEDPAEYERQLSDGELSDDRNGPSNPDADSDDI
jgi:hypothetical protein